MKHSINWQYVLCLAAGTAFGNIFLVPIFMGRSFIDSIGIGVLSFMIVFALAVLHQYLENKFRSIDWNLTFLFSFGVSFGMFASSYFIFDGSMTKSIGIAAITFFLNAAVMIVKQSKMIKS